MRNQRKKQRALVKFCSRHLGSCNVDEDTSSGKGLQVKALSLYCTLTLSPVFFLRATTDYYEGQVDEYSFRG